MEREITAAPPADHLLRLSGLIRERQPLHVGVSLLAVRQAPAVVDELCSARADVLGDPLTRCVGWDLYRIRTHQPPPSVGAQTEPTTLGPSAIEGGLGVVWWCPQAP
jgi:hypothetical protein